MNNVTNIVHFYTVWFIYSYFYTTIVRKSNILKNSAYLSFLLTSKGTNLCSIDSPEGTGQVMDNPSTLFTVQA